MSEGGVGGGVDSGRGGGMGVVPGGGGLGEMLALSYSKSESRLMSLSDRSPGDWGRGSVIIGEGMGGVGDDGGSFSTT